MCVCVCVFSLTSPRMRCVVEARLRTCARVCVCVFSLTSPRTRCVVEAWLRMCVCVCVCVFSFTSPRTRCVVEARLRTCASSRSARRSGRDRRRRCAASRPEVPAPSSRGPDRGERSTTTSRCVCVCRQTKVADLSVRVCKRLRPSQHTGSRAVPCVCAGNQHNRSVFALARFGLL